MAKINEEKKELVLIEAEKSLQTARESMAEAEFTVTAARQRLDIARFSEEKYNQLKITIQEKDKEIEKLKSLKRVAKNLDLLEHAKLIRSHLLGHDTLYDDDLEKLYTAIVSEKD